MIESMYGMGVDTLKAARALERAGFESAQAEALVAAFGGSVAGGAATREDLRDLRNASREDSRELRAELKEEIAEVRTELKEDIAAVRAELKEDIAAVRAELAEVRTELKGDIAELRTELKGEIAELREETRAGFATVREEMDVVKADIADLKTEMVKVRSAGHDDIKSLKAQMYGLLLAQATLIVGLIVGLQRLL